MSSPKLGFIFAMLVNFTPKALSLKEATNKNRRPVTQRGCTHRARVHRRIRRAEMKYVNISADAIRQTFQVGIEL